MNFTLFFFVLCDRCVGNSTFAGFQHAFNISIFRYVNTSVRVTDFQQVSKLFGCVVFTTQHSDDKLRHRRHRKRSVTCFNAVSGRWDVGDKHQRR
ncbi:hypothetical protein D3C85_1745470 [compost metagenome]